MGNTNKPQNASIKYSKVPTSAQVPNFRITEKGQASSNQSNEQTFRNTSNLQMKDVVQISTEIETKSENRQLDITIDHEEFVKLFMDPRVELNIKSLGYLIGYKMVHVVDGYRQRIPNVIAIVTLKINSNNNAIFQSEGKHSKKDHYEMMDLSKKLDSNNFYNRDSQGESLRFTGGDMVAWEHSTKYCAHNVETLALTFCGKFKEVIRACQLYDKNMAFAESAYTYEENQEPVVYEVGKTNYSKTEVPNVASGKCLDFFHFFLRPEYAIDYGFWQFQFSDGKSDINKAEIVLGKKFVNLRKVNHSECYKTDFCRDRSDVEFVKTSDGYVSNQVLKNIESNKKSMDEENAMIDIMAVELAKEIENSSLGSSLPNNSSPPKPEQLCPSSSPKIDNISYSNKDDELTDAMFLVNSPEDDSNKSYSTEPIVESKIALITEEDLKTNIELGDELDLDTKLDVELDANLGAKKDSVEYQTDQFVSSEYDNIYHDNPSNFNNIVEDEQAPLLPDGLRLRKKTNPLLHSIL